MTRSISKGPYVETSLVDKIKKVKSSGRRDVVKTYKRASMVVPEMVGLTLAIHDGRKFVSVFITENMVGHSLGEFAPTRTFRVHSGQRKEEKAAGIAPAAPTAAAPTTTSAPVAPAASPAKPVTS
jgi:small subunit ribosomal protein S19